ncbi:NUDIX hydrolase [Devosia pacifica]|uniref:NUDIX hydrolase n=1 Tax=Devosia pacifica TaxID=1335967 RepID=A0A918VXD4_9HYPH|nr:NUDIX hydrolase [Devosia pacifica]GHA31266.1 NUDIX hydrolase [Devosia pacifica]
MALRLVELWGRLVHGEELRTKVAALPYAIVDGRIAFLLVTSRRRGRWIVPKGNLMEGRSWAESAAIEAFEEAGVEGEIGSTPIGSYMTISKGRRTQVHVFPLLVTHQHDSWDEKGQRHRHWVLMPEARRLLGQRQLTTIVSRYHRKLSQSAMSSRIAS